MRRLVENGHASAAALGALTALVLGAVPNAAHSDWALGADAGVRHDDNVGNAELSSDIVADSILVARLSLYRLFLLSDGFSLTVGGDLGGEAYHRITGLNNASLGATFALKKKWGLGPFVPWLRIGGSAARLSYKDGYRDAWDYRATLASGRRIDERWNLWAEYTYESRNASAAPEVVPGLSGDAYSQVSHNLAAYVEYSLSERAFLSLGLSGRHGDVVSTSEPNTAIYYASRALAEDPAFGPEAYAYKLPGTTWGARVGISYATTEHSLLGAGFEHLDTHADGGNNYTKSIVEITWDYRF